MDSALFCIPRCVFGWIWRGSRPPLGRVASAPRADEVIFESADNQIFSSTHAGHTLLQRDSPNGRNIGKPAPAGEMQNMQNPINCFCTFLLFGFCMCFHIIAQFCILLHIVAYYCTFLHMFAYFYIFVVFSN